MVLRTLFILLCLIAAGSARACTVCDSERGVAVRSGIFNESFFSTLLEVAAPFPVLGLALYCINRWLPD